MTYSTKPASQARESNLHDVPALPYRFDCHGLGRRSLRRTGPGENAGGASVWQDKLVVRLVAPDGFALRKFLLPIISVLRNGAPVPKVWNL